jgi:hypothetical protein
MMKQLWALLVLLLAGCAASAQTHSASVNINALLSKHPLYGTLAQYDRQIAVLESTLHTRFANSNAQIANASSNIGHDLNEAAGATQSITNRQQAAAEDWNMLAPDTQTSSHAADIEADIQQAYAQQRSDLGNAAQRDMAAYRAALAVQQQTAYNRFVQSVNDRTQRAYNARAQELREKESALLLELARKNAPQRLILRTKLQTLALTSSTRHHFEALLGAMQHREYRMLQLMRAKDAATLREYAAQLRARSDRDIASMRTQLQARTNANLSERQRVLAEQTSGSRSLHLPSMKAPASSTGAMRAQYESIMHAPPADSGVFTRAGEDLKSRFGALGQADWVNVASIRSQIAWLQHDRAAVRKRIIAQILFEAQRVAKARDLWLVYTSARTPPPSSVDLTAAVAADLRELSP